MPPKKQDERALILAPTGQDASAMAALLKQRGITAQVCASPAGCSNCVDAGAGVLLLTEEALDLPEISGVLDSLKHQPPWSALPVIVLTDGGESRRSKLLEHVASAAGSVTLLERPMSSATLWRSVQVALESRRRQYLLRDLMEFRGKLASIVESSEDAIISKDLNGIITSWNRGAQQLFGFKPKEAIGRSILIIIPPERHAEETHILERVRRGESVEHFETVRRRKDGSLVDISLRVSPMRDESGRVIGASKIARDITERKRAEAELARRAHHQQELYKLVALFNLSVGPAAMMDAALDALKACLNVPHSSVVLLEEDGASHIKASRGLSENFLQHSEAFSPWPVNTHQASPVVVNDVRISSLDRELLRAVRNEGVGALAFIPLLYQGRLLGRFTVYYDTPHAFNEEELQLALTIANQLASGLSRKNNEDALRAATYRLADQAKELSRLVDERTAELLRTNKQLESFIYSVAHDLRGPLRSMQSFSELLLEEKELTEEGKDFSNRINRSAQFMDRLLTDLLNVSRMTQQQVELAPVPLKTTLQSVLAMLQPRIQETQARIEVSDAWPSVMAHEPTLAQVLMNLIDNALKFMPENMTPVVRVRSEERDSFIRVWIEDNGIGIPVQYQEQIFRLFSRLHGGTYPGTGIGLAIVQRGVERMGGRAGVESASGNGSRFWFELPKS